MDVDVSQFGAFRFNEVSRFNEMVSYTAAAADFAEGVFGMDVLVYEPHTTVLRARYGSDQDENAIESANFEFIEGGCGAFTIKLNEKPENLNIHRGDRIDIHLMRTVRPWFSGRVTQIPGVNTQGIFEVRGHGYAELLEDIRVDEDYQDQPVEKIVIDLANTYLGKRDIGFFSDRFMPIGYSIKHLQFDRISMKEALKKLADLAHHYVFGVDEEREFFFRPIEGRPLSRYSNKASHWVGYHLEGFELKEKTEGIINMLYVKIGSIQADDSNFADFIKQDLDSIAFFGEKSKVITAPEIKDEDDAGLWAEYQLEVSAWPEITGRAKGLHLEDWVMSRADLLRAEGFLRVSMPRKGLVAPYYEPLNGYYRYEDLDTSLIHNTNWFKRTFTCRQGGHLGRIDLLLKRHGNPGNLDIEVKLGSASVDTKAIVQADIPDWFTWLSIDLAGEIVRKDLEYTIEISSPGGGPPPLHPTACCTDPEDDQDNTTGWQAYCCTLTSEAGGVTGQRLKVASTDYGAAAHKGNISMTAGKLYRMKAKAGADVGDEYRLQLWSVAYGDCAFRLDYVAGAGAGNWDEIDFNFECPSTQIDWRLYLEVKINGDNGYFDNVDLREVAPIDCYEVLHSTHDSVFSGAFYESPDSGVSWAEDTGKGLIFRSYLIHEDEFILAIKKARYKITPNDGISVDVDLGEIDEPLAARVLNLLRGIEAEKLLQQSNVADLV